MLIFLILIFLSHRIHLPLTNIIKITSLNAILITISLHLLHQYIHLSRRMHLLIFLGYPNRKQIENCLLFYTTCIHHQ